MPKQLSDILVVPCVLVILTGLVLDLNQRSHFGFPILLGGGAALAGVLLGRSRLMRRATLIGFLVGAAVPVGWGIYGISHELAYRSSNPGEGFCGMGMLGAQLAIFIGGPFCGTVAAAVVATGAAICRAIRPDTLPAPPSA